MKRIIYVGMGAVLVTALVIFAGRPQ